MVDDRCPAGSLENCWVVILMDPDWSDWSPWSVVAKNKEAAIVLARRAWSQWTQAAGWGGDDSEEADEAEVVKVYRNSWIGQIE